MSYFRSESANMNTPLAYALATSWFANPSSSRGSAVEAITNSSGNCPPPGSGGGVVAMTRTPGIALSFPNASGRICSVVRFRSLHGFTPMPEIPPKGCVSWKVCLVSGIDRKASFTLSM